MNVSNRHTEKISPASRANPNQGPSLSRDPRTPVLSSRPRFFSLLPSADVKRTEISFNAAQRRVTGFIRFITGRLLFVRDMKASVVASQKLVTSARESTFEEMKENISSSADINSVDEQGMSAIMHAAQRGNLCMIKALVAAGSGINMANNDGKTALMLAAEEGYTVIVDYLINWGADLTRTDSEGYSAFALAARAGKTAVIQAFNDAGVDIDAPIDNGSTPLMFAAESGRMEFIKELIAKGAKVNKTNIKSKMTAVMYAARKGQTEVVKLLLAQGASVDAKDAESWTALMKAARNGHTEIVKLLLEKGASMDAKDAESWTALMKAARNGHTEIVELLLTKGASVDAKDAESWTALMKAARNGHTKIVELLLEKGASVDAKDVESWTALMKAARNGHTEIVELLIAENASVDAKDAESWTALMKAAYNGHTKVVKLLLAKGASVDAKDAEGATALLKAARNGHTEIVELLLSQGASVDAKTAKSATALMKAARNGHTEIVKLLLAKGASVDAKTAKGTTALICAAMRGHDATLTALIESCVSQYDALLSVMQYKDWHIATVIVRSWLNSKKNKLDALSAINSCTHDTVTNFPAGTRINVIALDALAEAGLTLTKAELATFKLAFPFGPKTEWHMKKFLVDGHISEGRTIGNAYWSGNHALVDELIGAPSITRSNPLGLVSPAKPQNFHRHHLINDNGDYLHAIGRLHDGSPELTWHCDVDPMVKAGWRTKVAATLRSARNEATEASEQISRLLADPERGFTLIDKDGLPMGATNIRLKDTLFAFELERNEPLHQIVNPPVEQSLTDEQVKHQEALQAQAKAILASNKNYSRLKLNMPALAQAKDLEKQVRSGDLTGAEAAVKLDELLSKTEQTYLEPPPGITSELAYHWFISEVGEVCEALKTMRDQFKQASPAVPAQA